MTTQSNHYDDDFKQAAVDLLFSSGRPLKHICRELGVSANALRSWRDQATGKRPRAQAGPAEPGGRSAGPLADPAAEIRRLQREVDYLTRQREWERSGHSQPQAARRASAARQILKKAVGILSEAPGRSMP